MERAGRCMCGAVTFVARGVGDASACHCGMCRRWAGGPWIGAHVESIEWNGAAVTTIKSSEWAERGFCNQCGSGLFYRITADGDHKGMTSVSLGTLDDQSGIEMTREWFIDKKPDCYALEGERPRVTEAEAFAMFSQ